MAEQCTGGYEEEISLNPTRRAIFNLVECNRELKMNNKILIKMLEDQQVEFAAEKSNFVEDIQFLNQLLEMEKRRSASKDENLAIQQKIINEMKVEASQKIKVKRKTAVTDNKHYYEQTSTEIQMKKMQEKLEVMVIQMKKMQEKLEAMVTEEKQTKKKHSAQIFELQNKIRQITEQSELLILQNKKLGEDRRHPQSELRDLADARYSLVTIKRQGRFEINRKCLECKHCHHVFNSLAEMQASQCLYHPANPSPTDTNGTHFWKCCQAKAAGKSPPGCKKGKHVPKYPDRDK